MRGLGHPPPGVFEVCEIGCGGFYQLVVTGPDRGFVWVMNPDGQWSPELSDESHLPIYSGTESIPAILDAAIRSPQSLKMEFADWYLKWLNQCIQTLKAQGKAPKRRRDS